MKRALIFFLVLFSSCAPTKELHRRASHLSPHEIIEAVNAHSGAISTFRAKGSISIESPSFLNSGSFELWLKKPDSVRVEIEGPFGIRVASALFTHGHFMFYNSFKNEVMEGSVDEEEMPPFMNIRIKPDDVVNTFCGTRSFLLGETSPDSFAISEDSYVLQFHHNRETTRYHIDDQTLFITGIEHIDSTGAVWSEEHFDFEQRNDGTVVPQSIRLTHEAMQSSVSLFYETVRVNTPVGAMTLNIPADARRVTRE